MLRNLRASLAARTIATLVAFTFLVVAMLMGGFYIFGVRQPIMAIQRTVEAEAAKLVAIDRHQGEPALVAALAKRQAAPAEEMAYGTLIGPDGMEKFGNLPSWPSVRHGDWVRIEADLYRDGDEHDHESITRDIVLPGGRRLLVGRDVEVYADRQELMIDAALWTSLGVLLFGLLGGVIISRISSNRIERVVSTARLVMAGDLTVRVPVKGTGDDFDELGRTLNAMLVRNQELVESLGRVSDSIAHELRTPLSRLRSLLHQLEMADGAADGDVLLGATIDEASRIEATFDALLRIARLQTRRHQIRRTEVEFDRLVADAVEYYLPEAEAQYQAITTECEACRIEGDRDLLFQLVTNLLDNAVKFAPVDGRINVTLRREDGIAKLTVRDSGGGVPIEDRPRLTERFFRAPGAHGVQGTGLGLALANAIVNAHGGTIGFDGEPGAFEVEVGLPERGQEGKSDGALPPRR